MGCGTSSIGGRIQPTDVEEVKKSHFDIERIVGHGGFGKVNAVVKNRGYDKNTWYAMKTLSKSVILERNHVAMVLQERNLLARLHCPQLVNMHYAFQDARNLYIVMDACLGGDLHYQLMHSSEKSFPEHQARFYIASIIVCLEYMHSVGVLHRDVKPENLLLDSRGQLKVTDLGISMEMKDGICTSTSGTRPYMAPEVFMSGHKHSTVADFYSLGITAYQFLVGSRPYRPESNNMRAIVRMAMFVPPEKYTDVRQIRRILIAAQERKAPSQEFQYSRKLAKFSAEARDFVQSCLICNPRYRLGSGGIIELLDHPWFAGLDWDAIRSQAYPAPFVPDVTQANCAISPQDLEQMVLNEEEQEMGPEIPPAEQKKFEGYNYRVWAQDDATGRNERIIRRHTSQFTSRHENATLTGGAQTELGSVSAYATDHRLRAHRTSDTGMMNASFHSVSSFHTQMAQQQQGGGGQGQQGMSSPNGSMRPVPVIVAGHSGAMPVVHESGQSHANLATTSSHPDGSMSVARNRSRAGDSSGQPVQQQVQYVREHEGLGIGGAAGANSSRRRISGPDLSKSSQQGYGAKGAGGATPHTPGTPVGPPGVVSAASPGPVLDTSMTADRRGSAAGAILRAADSNMTILGSPTGGPVSVVGSMLMTPSARADHGSGIQQSRLRQRNSNPEGMVAMARGVDATSAAAHAPQAWSDSGAGAVQPVTNAGHSGSARVARSGLAARREDPAYSVIYASQGIEGQEGQEGGHHGAGHSRRRLAEELAGAGHGPQASAAPGALDQDGQDVAMPGTAQ